MTTIPAPGADLATDELLPCPFCGGTDIAQKHGDPVALRWQYIQCNGCGASSIQSAYMYRAISAWNRRALLVAVPASEPVARLRLASEAIARAKKVPAWDSLPHALHVELDALFKAVEGAAPAPVSGMPDEPTLEMAKAFRDADIDHDHFIPAYRAMKGALPAAPAPTGKVALQALVDQAQELNMGYGEAPTEQASGLPPLPKGHRADEYTGSTLVYGYSEMRQVQQDAYALAARQASSENEFARMMSDANATHIACMMGNMIYNLAQKKGHMLTAADCEMFNNLRGQWDAARQAPTVKASQ